MTKAIRASPNDNNGIVSLGDDCLGSLASITEKESTLDSRPSRSSGGLEDGGCLRRRAIVFRGVVAGGATLTSHVFDANEKYVIEICLLQLLYSYTSEIRSKNCLTVPESTSGRVSTSRSTT
jgi:hypothetical protein